MAFIGSFSYTALRKPFNDPENKGFHDYAEKIFQKLHQTPGFVKMVTDLPEPLPYPSFVDPVESHPLFILSIWEGIEPLYQFSYKDAPHVHALRERRNWVQKTNHPTYVLWYVDDPESLTFQDAVERMEAYYQNGPSSYAFDFKHRFGEDGQLLIG